MAVLPGGIHGDVKLRRALREGLSIVDLRLREIKRHVLLRRNVVDVEGREVDRGIRDHVHVLLWHLLRRILGLGLGLAATALNLALSGDEGRILANVFNERGERRVAEECLDESTVACVFLSELVIGVLEGGVLLSLCGDLAFKLANIL